MKIQRFTVGPFLEHTYILSDAKSREAYVIDPGGWNEKALKYIQENQLHLKAIMSTHGHIDHIAGAYDLRKATEAPYRLSQKDDYLLQNLDRIVSYFGFPKIEKPIVDETLKEGDVLELGESKIQVVETPGHTPGGVCFLIENHIFVGDTLFNGSVGRTDLPGGNHDQLIESIQKKLLILDADLTVYCGHGLDTTIGNEKKNNPFLVKGHSQFL